MASLSESLPARVVSVKDNLVSIELTQDQAIRKNEVVYVHCGEDRLKAEVLRILGRRADIQVFEDTGGTRVGDPVELSGEMLSVTLGPGLLGGVFDGLQGPLASQAKKDGFFLRRGAYLPALDESKLWAFHPTAQVGDKLGAGEVLGTVQEGRFEHKIMVGFDQVGQVEVTWIKPGEATVKSPVARVLDQNGQERTLNLAQRWPVRRPMASRMLRSGVAERLYPQRPLLTTIRLIDTFFPIAQGGTGCIPGPFGAGKTVLQGLIARYSTVDIVIIVACGERAGEVVETITDFPNLPDPRSGGTLMDRTIIVCNTSSMPVAARESSIYTGITMGEYYRMMGYDVLLIADSTSRWAQALREISGRMEEIPGEEAFPAYLDSNIKNLYERAGIIKAPHGEVGSLTMLGTVSPAGGNFEEPVTQATMATVKTFLGLSYARAYKRFYPAIDPFISWSRYFDQMAEWYKENIGPEWLEQVQSLSQLLEQGDTIYQMMQVTGEEGITLEDYVTWQKATLVDMVYLQQDAFDEVDVSMPLKRQLESFQLLRELVRTRYTFEDKAEVRDYFIKLTAAYKNLNYSPTGSPDFQKYLDEIHALKTAHCDA